jgi:hypothetical protein
MEREQSGRLFEVPTSFWLAYSARPVNEYQGGVLSLEPIIRVIRFNDARWVTRDRDLI